MSGEGSRTEEVVPATVENGSSSWSNFPERREASGRPRRPEDREKTVGRPQEAMYSKAPRTRPVKAPSKLVMKS